MNSSLTGAGFTHLLQGVGRKVPPRVEARGGKGTV